MSVATLDPPAAVRQLTAAGFTDERAEVLVTIERRPHPSVRVTRSELTATQPVLKTDLADMKAGIIRAMCLAPGLQMLAIFGALLALAWSWLR